MIHWLSICLLRPESSKSTCRSVDRKLGCEMGARNYAASSVFNQRAKQVLKVQTAQRQS